MLSSDRIASGALALLIGLQLLFWIPAYLQWPLFADHDVFFTTAQAWSEGMLPYREMRMNNFPGALYLAWGIGKAGGWGNPPFARAAEAALVLAYGAMVVAWSRRRLGALWPGLYGVLTLLGFYLFLDYKLTGQRDTFAPMLALTSLMLLDGWRQRWALVASGVAMSAALCFRPHCIVFLPGVAALLLWKGEGRVRALALWSCACAAATAAWLYPLWQAGVLGDFVRSVRSVAYGGEYSARSGESTLAHALDPLKSVRVLVCLAGFAAALRDRSWWPWAVVLGGAMAYIPISPALKPYLTQPVGIVAALLAVPGAWALSRWRRIGPAVAALLLVIAMRGWPTFARPARRDGVPTGYVSNVGGLSSVVVQDGYRWQDLSDTLAYIRVDQPANRRIANLLSGAPAICASTGRLSAFPFESVAWVKVVRPSDTGLVRETLEKRGDWLVVLSSREHELRWMRDSDEALRRNYRPEARFGEIEVWKSVVK
ncbi:MAG: hypothetical protein U0Q16_26510 [Bryobacteraceae bacterium]